MDTPLTADAGSWKEGRRLRAYELHEQGWKQKDIAAALGVTGGAVSQWLKRARDGGGAQALRHRVPPGRIPRLTEGQRQQIPELLTKGAEAYGFSGAVWTLPRVADVLQQQFQVTHSSVQVGRILRSLGWSRQQPEVRATQRKEDVIAEWQATVWPALKKKPMTKNGPSSSPTK
jgi:transposase